MALPDRDADEACVLGSVLDRPDALLPDLSALESDHFKRPFYRSIWNVIRNRQARGDRIGAVLVADELGEHPGSDGEQMFYADVTAIAARAISDDAAVMERVDRLMNGHADPTKLLTGTRCPALVGEILSRANETWISLSLGADEIYRMRPGSIAMLTGSPGSGKSTVALAFALAHLKAGGSVLYVSVELDGDELVARLIGMQCDESWEGVLRGKLAEQDMARVAAHDRLVVLDGDDATLAQLELTTKVMSAEHRDSPLLLIVDYLQIVPSDGTDIRARVSAVAQRLRRLVKELRIVGLGVSQPSRVAGKALGSGELLGADSMTAMAESSEIERAAYVTLALGQRGEQRADGTSLIDLSVGKGRFGGGDQVVPLSIDGRSGHVRVGGETRPTAEVRAERSATRQGALLAAAKLAMLAFTGRATAPVTRRELTSAAATRRGTALLAISELLGSEELVEVRLRRPRSDAWLIWTVAQAQAAGIPIVKAAN